MALCIPAPTVAKIKEALVSGKLSIEGLYNMASSEARQAEWSKYLAPELAKWTNTKFEAAAASKSKMALTKFFKEITTKQEAKTVKTKNILDKIAHLEDADLLNPESQTAAFTDLISHRLGVAVTAEEVESISKKAKKIERLKLDAISAQAETGLPTKEYFKKVKPALSEYYAAMTDMDKFINGLDPTHNLKVATGTIGRGNMLLNVPPATVNTISNIVQGTMQALERRITSNQYLGSNSEFAREYFKMAVGIFTDTGYDISRAYAEDIRLGEHIIHSEGPGIIRKTGRGISKVVFKYLLGYSDTVSAAAAAADSTNIAATKIARKMGLKGEAAKQKALEIFQESVKIQPDVSSDVTKEAFIVRQQAIADAEFATWTNKGFISNLSMGLRDWLNEATGDLQIGYWNIPFVKTGANVIQFGIESTPIGTIIAAAKLKSALNLKNDKINPDPVEFQKVMRTFVRSGMGFALSMIVAALIPPDDFFSAYEAVTAKQREQMGLKKGVYNAVKISGKWISLDFFGALGAGFVGMMYAKKYGRSPGDTVFKYVQGLGKQILQVPGLIDFEDLYASIKEVLIAETAGEAAIGAAGGVINSVRSRVIPSIVNTLAKATDPVVRKIDRADLLARTKAGIPGLRQTLPVKISPTTGEEIKGEGFWTNLLFGSRVKTANESALIDEISRLEVVGEAPAIADIERSSKRVQGLKTQLSENLYQSALKFYGREYGRRAAREILRASYRRASDEDKKKMLNAIRTEVRNQMLRKFHYRKNRGLKR